MTQTGAVTPGQSKPRSNGTERVLHIPQSSIAEAWPLADLVSYAGHSLNGFYPSAGVHSA